MSCYLVSRKDIALLTEAFFKYEVTIPDGVWKHPDTIGQTLWNANYQSWNERYDETDTPPCYVHEGAPLEQVRNPLLVYKQVRHYCYQSCDFEAWEDSEAYRLMEALKDALCRSLNMAEEKIHASAAYDDLPWGLS